MAWFRQLSLDHAPVTVYRFRHLCGGPMRKNVWHRVLLTVLVGVAQSGLAMAQDACQSAIRSAGAVQIDIAPPGHFIDVCSEDASLCKRLTSGYPPSVSTLAYFVLPGEWEASRDKPHGFTRYLIAQLAGSMSPHELPEFKQHLHAQQGEIPDHTTLPSTLQSRGRVPLGIVNEAPDSISFGTIMELEPTTSSQGFELASINSMIVVRDRVLSLYAFDEVKDPASIEPLKSLSERWLTCLRQNNPVIAQSTNPVDSDHQPKSAASLDKATVRSTLISSIPPFLYENWKKYGQWDYKQRGSRYRDITQFNFGAVGSQAKIDQASLIA
jgi:hypothetical protein